MSTTTVSTVSGVEAWCDECGSVAWFRKTDGAFGRDEERQAADAAQVHEATDHAPVWLDDEGEPTTENTGRWAGGCDYLREHARVLLEQAHANVPGSPH